MKLSMTLAGVSLFALMLSACATEPTQAVDAVGATPSPDDMICTREYPTGSNLPVKHCRTRAQIEQERNAAQEGLRRGTTGGPIMQKGG